MLGGLAGHCSHLGDTRLHGVAHIGDEGAPSLL
jgi:hypothetical protein